MAEERINHQWRLASRPTGRLGQGDFTWHEEPLPAPGEGQAIVRVVHLSLDPTQRIWASDMPQYMPPVEIGEVMRGGGIGIVEESRIAGLAPGDLVSGLVGWQECVLVDESAPLSRITPAPGVPLTAYLGLFSHIGATAYFGLKDVAPALAGETVVVTAAAGAVGSIAGQIAKAKDCRVIGVAGTDEKCRWITEELGVDVAINYKAEPDLTAALGRACPNGIDVVFENVGGAQLDASLSHINLGGRIAICGLISTYEAQSPVPGPYRFSNVLMKRVRVRGFIVSDFIERFPEAMQALGEWYGERKVKYRVDMVDGLENAPSALNKLFDGTNKGKLIVKVSNEPNS